HARGCGVRHVLLGVRRQRARPGHLDPAGPLQGHPGGIGPERFMTTRPIPDPGRRGGVYAVALAAIVALAMFPACSPKITSLDSDYQTVEGKPSPFSQLVLWADEGAASYYYQDMDPADPDEKDVLLGTDVVRAYPPGTLRGMVLDSTMADEYQVFRREPG